MSEKEVVRLLNRLWPWTESGEIFGITSKTVTTLFGRAVDLAGIEGLTFHDSRHEAITRFATKLEVLDLASMFGYRVIKQLMTCYNKLAAGIALSLD